MVHPLLNKTWIRPWKTLNHQRIKVRPGELLVTFAIMKEITQYVTARTTTIHRKEDHQRRHGTCQLEGEERLIAILSMLNSLVVEEHPVISRVVFCILTWPDTGLLTFPR